MRIQPPDWKNNLPVGATSGVTECEAATSQFFRILPSVLNAALGYAHNNRYILKIELDLETRTLSYSGQRCVISISRKIPHPWGPFGPTKRYSAIGIDDQLHLCYIGGGNMLNPQAVEEVVNKEFMRLIEGEIRRQTQ